MSTEKAKGRTEQFKFDITNKVIIREIQRPGTVEAMTIDCLGTQYRIAYWDNSERKSVWLSADELASR